VTNRIDLTFAPIIDGAQLATHVPKRRVAGVVVPFGDPSGPASNNGQRYRFSSPPLNVDDPFDLVREHDDDRPIGRGELSAESAALLGSARLFTTRDGDDALVEAQEGVRAAFSAGVEILSSTPADDGVIDVHEWNLTHVAQVRRPAFAAARITDVAASAAAESPERNPAMADPVTLPAGESVTVTAAGGDSESEATAPAPDAAASLSARPVAAAQLSAADVRAMIDARMDAGNGAGSPLARFASFGEYADAARRDPEIRFALADQITTNNPGVVNPHWLTEIKGIIQRSRPLISAFGTESPGDAGMSVDWPYFDGDLSAIVAAQATEKTPVNGVRIDIKKGDAPLGTLAAGSDISYQLLSRSSPSYREAHDRILTASFAVVSDATASAAVLATDGIGHVTYDPAGADADGSKLRAALLEASLTVNDATGQPAEFVLAGRTSFLAVASKPQVMPSPYGVQNVSGTADARSLSVSVSGLDVIYAPGLTDDAIIVSNGAAGSWFDVGPFFATAEDVAKLGQDVAIWGMGAFGAFTPAAIVSLAKTAPAAP
jgi:hypothetical protein